jgi:hypothetical protein
MSINVASYIPKVMNALYNDEAFNSTSLTEMRDAFREKQIQGKQWLMDAVSEYCYDKNKSVLVVGGWFGFTSLCLHELGFKHITEVDPDSRLDKLSRHLNRFNLVFTRVNDDINNIDISQYDIIINPSCEHILDNTWFDNISPGTILILHSTDYQADDHPNTCSSVDEMVEKYPMNLIITDVLDLGYYKRFMLVGRK